MGREKILPKNSKRYCSRCGIQITTETTYVRKNGFPIAYCKNCDKILAYEKRWKKEPVKKIREALQKYKSRMEILGEILSKKTRRKAT